jgi:hypothetical protein
MECVGGQHTCPIFAAVWTSRSTLSKSEQLCLRKTHSSLPQQHRSSVGCAAMALMAPMTSRGRAPAPYLALEVSAIPTGEEGEIYRRIELQSRIMA